MKQLDKNKDLLEDRIDLEGQAKITPVDLSKKPKLTKEQAEKIFEEQTKKLSK